MTFKNVLDIFGENLFCVNLIVHNISNNTLGTVCMKIKYK